jgi:NDP-sugar pyrophosphorylase family protein
MSRSLLSALAVVSLLAVSPTARADDDARKEDKSKGSRCTINVKKGDLVTQGKDLVVEDKGPATRDAVAIDGNVVVRAGTTVNNVAAIRGKVTIEAGARVAGDASAIGGDVHIQKGASVAGDVTAIGGQLQADEGATIAGEKNQISININGEEFLQKLIGGLITGNGTRDCQLRLSEN